MTADRTPFSTARTGAISAAAVIAATGLTAAPAQAAPPAATQATHATGQPGTVASAELPHVAAPGAVSAHLVLRVAPAAGAGVESARAARTHVVRPGDTVWDLAKKYGTTVAAIVEANDLDSRATIRVGERLTVPGASSSKPAQTSKSSARKTAAHVVSAGDTVWDLAHRHGTTVAAIVDANDLGASAVIHVGQRLRIPGSTVRASAETKRTSTAGTASSRYTVKAGDTLSRIAVKFHTTVTKLAATNHIADPSLIRVGEVLKVPGSVPSGASTSSSSSGNLVGDTFLGRTYPKDVVRSANANKEYLNSVSVPSRAQMRALVVKTAKRYGVDPALAQAIAYQESGFNMRAVSPANAVGTMQVIPATGEWMSQVVGRKLNLLDPEDNVTAGVVLLRYLTHNASSLNQAIAGYYQGLSGVRKYGMNPDTKDYVAAIRAHMKKFG